MIKAQDGDISVLDDYSKFKQAKICYEVFTLNSGFISSMDAEKIGIASMILGAGRETKDTEINNSAGIILNKKPGDFINYNEKIAEFYSSSIELCKRSEKIFLESLNINNIKIHPDKLIYAKVTEDSVEYL
jgi:pyrimidine-nucleoside phosphorylase